MLATALNQTNVSSWALLAVALSASWRITRGGGGSAVTELDRANKVLSERVESLGAEVRDLRVAKAKLEARTDFEGALTRALTPLAEAISHHDVGATQRSEALLKILDERLPA